MDYRDLANHFVDALGIANVGIGKVLNVAHPRQNVWVEVRNLRGQPTRIQAIAGNTCLTGHSCGVFRDKRGQYYAFDSNQSYAAMMQDAQFRRIRQRNFATEQFFVPLLLEMTAFYVPALIEKNQSKYGQIAVLFGRFKFYNTFPTELCDCKKWMPTSNGCVPTCNGEGMFDTQQECEDFRNNSASDNNHFYYAIKPTGDNWVAGKLDNAYQEYSTSSNLFVAKSGNIKMTGQFYNPTEPNDALKVTWTGEDGGIYLNSQIDLYYVGAEKYYRLGNLFYFQLELNSLGYLGVGGVVSGDPRSKFKSINFCWPENPIDKWELSGGKTFTQSVDPTLWLPRGIITAYQILEVPPTMPNFPDFPTPYPNDDGKYWGLELSLGGDREVPVSLGEFLINAPPTTSTAIAQTQYNINNEDLPWYQENNLLLPDWMQIELNVSGSQWSPSSATMKYEGTDKNKLSVFNLRYWSQIPNIRSYAVKLSETETEIVVKYSTFRKFKRIVSGAVLYDVMWCQIAIIKVVRGNVTRRNFKYPEPVECDSRNWAAPYFKNWYYAQIPDESGSGLAEHRLDQYSDTEQVYNPDSGSPPRGFFYMRSGYGQFAYPEMARYLFANTLELRGWLGSQGWESFSYPINPQAMHTKGVNFKVSNNKLYAWDIKPNQSISIGKNDRTYVLPLLDAIKLKTIDDAYIKYGELQRPEIVEGVDDSYQESEFSYPVSHVRMNNDNYLKERTFSFKSSPKIAQTKIYKIPDDCFVIEATAFIDPAKLETSSIILPPQLYQSTFRYAGLYEGDPPIGVSVQWLDNNWPTAFTTLTPTEKYFLEVNRLSAMQIYNRGDTLPTILLGCGANQTSLPWRSGAGFNGYNIGFPYDPILRGYC